MSLYVRVVDNTVTDVWDTAPAEGVGNNGWRNAVEIRPEITPHRQTYNGHVFDTTKDPVEIVYQVMDISVQSRKESMTSLAAAGFEFVVNQQLRLQVSSNPDEQYDAQVVEDARQEMLSQQAEILACETHEDLDLLI